MCGVEIERGAEKGKDAVGVQVSPGETPQMRKAFKQCTSRYGRCASLWRLQFVSLYLRLVYVLLFVTVFELRNIVHARLCF